MRPGVLSMAPKQSHRLLNGLLRHPPLGRRNCRIKNKLINFFDFQGVVHKEFVPEGKTVNSEFYKGVMYRLLKRIQQVRPAAFRCREFFFLHDNAPAHKASSV